jgi:hypothetical protein
MADDQLKLEPPIRAVIDATNAGDNKAFVAAFTKDGSISDWGQAYSGRAEISKWDRAENTGAQAQLRVTGVSRLGGEVLVLLEATVGGESSSGTWAFQLAGGAVSHLEIG